MKTTPQLINEIHSKILECIILALNEQLRWITASTTYDNKSLYVSISSMVFGLDARKTILEPSGLKNGPPS